MLRWTITSASLLVVLTTIVAAADPKVSESAVRDALRYGADGKIDEQRELLKSVLSTQPDLLVARGHAGFVRQGQEWVDFEELARRPEEVEKLAAYEAARQAAPDTLDGQLELANWCQQRGLGSQERVHLSRVLEFDADHAAARSRLGFVKRDGEWVSRDEQRAADAREREQRAALQKWRPQVRAIVTGLARKHGGSPDDVRERKKLQTKLAAITDPAAVTALEAELSAYLEALDDQPGSTEHKIADVLLPLVRAIGRIPHPQAAAALATIGVECALTVPMELPEAFVMEGAGPRFPSAAELDQAGSVADRLPREMAAVYRESIAHLKQHPRDSFVPLLLSGLSSPVQGEYLTYRERDGDVVVRLFYVRETEGRGEGQENRTTFQPKGVNSAAKARSAALSRQRALQQIQAAHQQLQQVNVAVMHRNLRVTDLLRAVTEQPLSTAPTSWWNWWNEENEVFLSGDKPLIAKVHKQTISVLAPPPPPPSSSSSSSSSSKSRDDDRKKDCLAAGTPIWTAREAVPIERLVAGDLVLAQHPETGELAYKPVLKTTQRPRGPLVEVQAGGETYRTSGGHPFWVIGEGWVRARRLEPGRKIYGIDGAVTIERVENSTDVEPTYNLIVADFHSYFVGDGRIYSHDNTMRHPTGMAVPGLARTLGK